MVSWSHMNLVVASFGVSFPLSTYFLNITRLLMHLTQVHVFLIVNNPALLYCILVNLLMPKVCIWSNFDAKANQFNSVQQLGRFSTIFQISEIADLDYNIFLFDDLLMFLEKSEV